MAIAFAKVNYHSRGAGHSAVRGAAYRSGEKLEDERCGKTEDFTKLKSRVDHSEIVLPEAALAALRDRSKLWNAAEFAEMNKDGSATKNARLAREIVLALPHELTPEQRVELARDYVTALVERHQFGADFSIHKPDAEKGNKNHHAHVMLTTRRIDETGLHAKSEKTKELDDFKQGPKEIKSWRDMWEGHANDHLKRAGLDIKIDMSSYKSRGIDKMAETHMGKAASQMEKKGVETDVGNHNRDVRERNVSWERLEELSKQEKVIDLQIAREKRAQAERQDYLTNRRADRQHFDRALSTKRQDFEIRREGALGQFDRAANVHQAASAQMRQDKLAGANNFWGKVFGKHRRIGDQNAREEAIEQAASATERRELLTQQREDSSLFAGGQKAERREFLERQLEQRRQRQAGPDPPEDRAPVIDLEPIREMERQAEQSRMDAARQARLQQAYRVVNAREAQRQPSNDRSHDPGRTRERGPSP